MRKLMIAATVLAGCAFAQTEDPAMAKLPALRTSIYGVPLTGERELAPTVAGKPDKEVDPMFRAAMRPVQMGESFQLTVELERPGGARQAVTSDPRTKYLGLTCLTVSASGFVSVSKDPIFSCNKGSPVQLWITMVDAQNQPQAWNRYVFVIAE